MPQLNPFTLFTLSSCVGLLSAYVAFRRGKNPYFWFLIGMVFGLLGLIFMLYMPKKKVSPPTAAPTPTFEEIIIGPTDKYWYYLNSIHEKQGPMSFSALNKWWKCGTITEKTLVWHEELSDWKPLQECIQKRRINVNK